MEHKPRNRLPIFLSLVIAVGIVAATNAGAQDITVELVPSEALIDVGEEILVEMNIAQPGLQFNAYDGFFQYDPAFLTFIPLTPSSLQEGPLMTGVCGNTFHIFEQNPPDELSVAHVILCGGEALVGPGIVYRLRFRAEQEGVTYVRLLPGSQFYDAGQRVGPIVSTDAEIVIGGAVGVNDLAPRRTLRLSVAPNPTRGNATIRIESESAGDILLDILNVQGKTIRGLGIKELASGKSQYVWDGRDDAGKRAPPGLYWAVVRRGSKTATTRFVVLR